MKAQVKTALTHVGTAAGAAVATSMWLATKSVDIYAIIDQLNTVVAETAKLLAMVTPLATGAYAVWKSSTRSKLEEIAADPKAPQIAKQIEPTPNIVAVADALKKEPSAA